MVVAVASKAAKVATGAGSKAAKATKGAGGRTGAAKATGARTRKGARTARPNLGDLPADQVNAELQERRRLAAEAGKDTAAAPAEDVPTSTQQPAPARQLPTLPASGAAATGSGFLLGVFAWAVGLAYLDGGSAGVKKFMRAKFFNKVERST